MADDPLRLLRAFVIDKGEIREPTPEEMATPDGIIRVCRRPDQPGEPGVPFAPSFCCFCGDDIVYNPFELVPGARHACIDCMRLEHLRQLEQLAAKKDETS